MLHRCISSFQRAFGCPSCDLSFALIVVVHFALFEDVLQKYRTLIKLEPKDAMHELVTCETDLVAAGVQE